MNTQKKKKTLIQSTLILAIFFSNSSLFAFDNCQPPYSHSDRTHGYYAHCRLIPDRDGWLAGIDNEMGERLYMNPNADNSINFLQRAVNSGFCQLNQQDYCNFVERPTHWPEDCSPRTSMRAHIYINNILVDYDSSPYSCPGSSGGSPDYSWNMERTKKILRQLCPSRNI